ncbi:MAG: Do family serine endopeptidase [Rhodospirillales bacterium]|nr:Do family serine endopeptidase [Alphaproteobacteria bacterium]MBL6948913.1 Do family serine endopeptidase [Rhodospirillales bacterium]
MTNFAPAQRFHKSLTVPAFIAVLVTVLMATSGISYAKGAPESFADLADELLPSVVNISTTQVIEGRSGMEFPKLPPGSPFEDFFKEFFDRNQPEQRSRKATSLGSGFIIGDGTHVVTNNHVIQDADEITVVLHDNTRLKAELVGRDPKTDLAVLKIKPENGLKGVKFGNSDVSRVGDWVMAIGNPFGLGGTVTAGIISARGRDINSGPYDDFLQTDASINRGNSGGPMFNLKGRVIGINTAIFSPSGGSVGIGFAIPSSVAEPVINQLIKHGQVRRGWLGVHIQAVSEEIAETLGLKEAAGALVANVIADGPAEKAKVRAGDVILKFNNKKVSKMRSLPRIVADTEVGKSVPIEVWRNNEIITLSAIIEELDDDAAKTAARGKKPGKNGKETTIKALGLTVAALTQPLREKFSLGKDAKGVVVVKVDENGPAAEKGIRAGDLIVEISQQEATGPDVIKEKVAEAKKAKRKSVLLLLEGQGGFRIVAVKIARKK